MSYKNRVLAIICLAAALVPFMGSAVNLSLPQIARDYQLGSIAQSWVLTAFLIAAAIFQIPLGKVADMVGKKQIFVAGLLLITLSAGASALPYGGVYLIFCRILQGLGSAMIFGTGMALITETFEAGDRGKALGINASVVYLSLALGPSVGGFIAGQGGWQSIFLTIAGASFIACVGSWLIIKPQEATAKGEPFDLAGAVMYGIAMVMSIYGFTILPSLWGIALTVSGIGLFVYFIRYEKQRRYPVLNVRLFFSNRVFTLSSVAALINYAVTFPIAFFMSLYLQEVKGFSVQTAGLLLIVQPSVQALLSPLTGYLSDKIRSHYLASGGMGLIVLALVGIALLITPQTQVWALIVMFVLLGMGFAFFTAPNTNIIMNSVERKDYSLASATTGTMRLTGQAVGMGISTMMLSFFLSGVSISAAVILPFMQTMRISFAVFAFLSLCGLYASTARNRK